MDTSPAKIAFSFINITVGMSGELGGCGLHNTAVQPMHILTFVMHAHLALFTSAITSLVLSGKAGDLLCF